MASSGFDLATVQEKFALTLREDEDLFATTPEVAPTPILRQHLDEWTSVAIAINTDRSRAEMIIMPVLMDVVRLTRKGVAIFTGVNLDVDRIQGLNGVCDDLLANPVYQLFITRPLVAIVEAKKEDLVAGLGQCIAEMVAARIFNAKDRESQRTVFRVVTAGNVWKFLKLDGSTASVDRSEYHLSQIEKILGIFVSMVRFSSKNS